MHNYQKLSQFFTFVYIIVNKSNEKHLYMLHLCSNVIYWQPMTLILKTITGNICASGQISQLAFFQVVFSWERISWCEWKLHEMHFSMYHHLQHQHKTTGIATLLPPLPGVNELGPFRHSTRHAVRHMSSMSLMLTARAIFLLEHGLTHQQTLKYGTEALSMP